jgi:hypothetical protein
LRREILVAAALAVLVPAAVRSQNEPSRGPSTAAERRRALETTRRLEKDPLGKGADEERQWLLDWIVAIPDIMVTSCSGPLDPLLKADGTRHGRELYVQSVFGMAAFLIQNPGKKDDQLAVQTAGIESVLAAYKAMLAKQPDARWPELDQLLDAKRKGKLPQVVKEEVDCNPNPEPRPPLDETI